MRNDVCCLLATHTLVTIPRVLVNVHYRLSGTSVTCRKIARPNAFKRERRKNGEKPKNRYDVTSGRRRCFLFGPRHRSTPNSAITRGTTGSDGRAFSQAPRSQGHRIDTSRSDRVKRREFQTYALRQHQLIHADL